MRPSSRPRTWTFTYADLSHVHYSATYNCLHVRIAKSQMLSVFFGMTPSARRFHAGTWTDEPLASITFTHVTRV